MGKLIVIIEDDRHILDFVSSTLHNEGYDVKGIDHVSSLEKVIECEPSLILLDNRLGDGFGSELCFSLKCNPATHHVPVVLVSSSHSVELIAKSCCADSFLLKPFEPFNLISIVNRLASNTDTFAEPLN